MATRSVKGLYDPKTHKVLTTYTHWDGYPDWVGCMLTKHYNTVERVKALLDFGDTSSLNPLLPIDEGAQNVDTSAFQQEVSVFYHQDRGEPAEEVKARQIPIYKFTNVENLPWGGLEFVYIAVPHKNGSGGVTWYVCSVYGRAEEYNGKNHYMQAYQWYKITPKTLRKVTEPPFV